MAESESHSFSVQVHGNKRGSEADYNIVSQAHSGDSSIRTPNILAYLSFTATRNSQSDSNIRISVSGGLERLCKYTSGRTNANFDSFTGNYGSSTYGYLFKVEVKFGANGTWKKVADKPASDSKWTGRGYGVSISDFTVSCKGNSIPVYFRCTGGCHIAKENWCPEGDYEGKIDNFSVPTYNPSTPATNASNGKIFSTNNTSDEASGRNILDKPDLEVWWTWTGATAGTPDSVNGIKQYNIDISNTNNVNNASSITETQNYTKNKHISLFTLCRSYNVKVGGTLYCWVNTQIKSGAWLRKSIFRFNYNEKRWFYKI